MKKIFVFLSLIILTISVHGQIDSSKYAIIPFSSSGHDWLFTNNCQPTSLNKEEITDIELLLTKAADNYQIDEKNKFIEQQKMREANHSDRARDVTPNFAFDISDFKKQFIPVLNKKGEKIVFVNCFCNAVTSNKNWRTEILDVISSSQANGSNTCEFFLKINLTSKIYYNVNSTLIKN